MNKVMNKEQYPIIAARRQSLDDRLWQVPALSVAAQAFLLTIVFDLETDDWIRLGISIFALLFGCAALQLWSRLRYLEMYDSELLRRYENRRGSGLAVLHQRERDREQLSGVEKGCLASIEANRVWRWILIVFIAVDVGAVFYAVTWLVPLWCDR